MLTASKMHKSIIAKCLYDIKLKSFCDFPELPPLVSVDIVFEPQHCFKPPTIHVFASIHVFCDVVTVTFARLARNVSCDATLMARGLLHLAPHLHKSNVRTSPILRSLSNRHSKYSKHRVNQHCLLYSKRGTIRISINVP